MKTRRLQKFMSGLILALMVTAVTCKKNLTPIGELSTGNVYKNFDNYLPIVAKLYDGFAVTGQIGGAGNQDVATAVNDEGTSNYIRLLFNVEELPTDEVTIQWDIPDLDALHDMNWIAGNQYTSSMFDRIYYEISLANEFLRNTADAQLSANGITGNNLALVKQYRAEARFLRALSYTHAIDLFGNVPFVTENDAVDVFFPVQKSRTDVFNYIESELKAIDTDLGAPRYSYGHADKAAAWALLAKLYLNAQVYTGANRSTDAITYADKVIAAGYTLEPHFKNLFTADNNNSSEIIFPIESDGVHTQGFGGTTYLVHAQVGGNMNAADFGIDAGWAGFRTTQQYVALFADPSGNTDKRAMFFTDGQSLNVTDERNINAGYMIKKFTNLTSAGAPGSDATGVFVDTDFPMFRLADIYLTYAEAVLRGGTGGDLATALKYVNMVRTRAYDGSAAGNITVEKLNLPFILGERGRELLFEMQRRTDLIRFGKFTDGSYLWAWKGKVINGKGVSPNRNLMPIPTTQLSINPGLKQNPGY